MAASSAQNLKMFTPERIRNQPKMIGNNISDKSKRFKTNKCCHLTMIFNTIWWHLIKSRCHLGIFIWTFQILKMESKSAILKISGQLIQSDLVKSSHGSFVLNCQNLILNLNLTSDLESKRINPWILIFIVMR